MTFRLIKEDFQCIPANCEEEFLPVAFHCLQLMVSKFPREEKRPAASPGCARASISSFSPYAHVSKTRAPPPLPFFLTRMWNSQLPPFLTYKNPCFPAACTRWRERSSAFLEPFSLSKQKPPGPTLPESQELSR